MSLQSLANHYRSQLQQRKAQDAQTLTAVHAQTIQQIKPQLDSLYRDITTKLDDVNTEEDETPAKIPLSWLHEGSKLEAIKQFITDRIDQFSAYAKMVVHQAQDWAVMIGNQVASLFMKNAKPGYLPEFAKPSVFSNLLNSAQNNVSGLFDTFGKDAAKGVRDALMVGMALGSKVKEIAQRVTQALDVPRWRAIAIAASELFRSYNETLMVGYRANAPALTGWTWTCRLSRHSCMCCVALHGTLHELTETLQDHVNGECTPLPYFDGYGVPQSGIEWFKGQSESLQREIMGTNVAYDLWKSGTPLEAFIGIDHSDEYGNSVYQRSAKQIRKGR